MKKLLVLGAILAIGVAAYAHGSGYGRGFCGQGGYGPGMMGQGYGQGGYGPGMMGQGYGQDGYGPGMMGPKGFRHGTGMANQNVKQFTEDEARKTFETFISENYKGYKIENVTPFNMPRGTIYSADVSDASGNKFVFRLNPWGNVVGPIINK